jgi:hypothetical protein
VVVTFKRQQSASRWRESFLTVAIDVSRNNSHSTAGNTLHYGVIDKVTYRRHPVHQ